MDTGAEEPVYLGYLEGHRDWVTCIKATPEHFGGVKNTIVSTSRDKKMIVWKLNDTKDESQGPAGHAVRALSGHSRPIQDLALSNNGKYAITGSWDTTLRLWDLETGVSLRTFTSHTSDVNSVALSPDNRQIVSGSRDKTIKLWNTVAECKFTIEDQQHTDWVSCTRFSPLPDETLIVSGGWDKIVKVWNLDECNLRTNLVGHSGAVYTVTISPDGSLCASGGKDGTAMLWDVNDGKHLFSINAQSTINALCFSPCHYWLCAATDTSIKIWNLEEDKNVICNLEKQRVTTYDEEGKLTKSKRPQNASAIPWCTTLTWSPDGHLLYAGSTDGKIYVYDFS